MSGLLGGPLAAIVATATATAVRFTMGEGNPGLIGVAMSASAAVGILAWAMGIGTSLRSLLAVGVVLAALRPAFVLLAGWLGWLDPTTAHSFLTETLPLTSLFYPAGVVIMGSLLHFEGRRDGQTAGLQSENRALAERDARYRAIFESSSVAMIWMEDDGRILLANKRMCDFTGYSASEMESVHYADLLAPDDREDYFRVRAEQQATGLPPKDRERRYRRKDGTFVWGLRSTALVHPDFRRADAQVRDDPGHHRAEERRAERSASRRSFWSRSSKP